jgi:hypothetical protein
MKVSHSGRIMVQTCVRGVPGIRWTDELVEHLAEHGITPEELKESSDDLNVVE